MDGRPTACRFSMPQKNPKNFKTGLILASIALVFFLGLVVKRMWFS